MAYVPITPDGTPLVNLSSLTEAVAWEVLMDEASHMPYGSRAAFEERGYTVAHWPGWEAEIRRRKTRVEMAERAMR